MLAALLNANPCHQRWSKAIERNVLSEFRLFLQMQILQVTETTMQVHIY